MAFYLDPVHLIEQVYPVYFEAFHKVFFCATGADVVIFERLRSGQEEIKTTIQDHLDVSKTRPN